MALSSDARHLGPNVAGGGDRGRPIAGFGGGSAIGGPCPCADTLCDAVEHSCSHETTSVVCRVGYRNFTSCPSTLLRGACCVAASRPLRRPFAPNHCQRHPLRTTSLDGHTPTPERYQFCKKPELFKLRRSPPPRHPPPPLPLRPQLRNRPRRRLAASPRHNPAPLPALQCVPDDARERARPRPLVHPVRVRPRPRHDVVHRAAVRVCARRAG